MCAAVGGGEGIGICTLGGCVGSGTLLLGVESCTLGGCTPGGMMTGGVGMGAERPRRDAICSSAFLLCRRTLSMVESVVASAGG